MADRLLLEASAVDGFLLEDASGVVLKEATAGTDTIYSTLHRIERGMVAQTAAGLGGVLEE